MSSEGKDSVAKTSEKSDPPSDTDSETEKDDNDEKASEKDSKSNAGDDRENRSNSGGNSDESSSEENLEDGSGSDEEDASDAGSAEENRSKKDDARQINSKQQNKAVKRLQRDLAELRASYQLLLNAKIEERKKKNMKKRKPKPTLNEKTLAERIRGWQVTELGRHADPGDQYHAWIAFKTTFQTKIKLYAIKKDKEKLVCLRAKGGREIANVLATVDKEDLTFREAWNSLENQFSAPIDKGAETAKFYGMKQARGEDIFAFFERISKQSRLCDFSPSELTEKIGEGFARRNLNPGYFLAAFREFHDIDALKSHARSFHLATTEQTKSEPVLEVNSKAENRKHGDHSNKRTAADQDFEKNYKRQRFSSPQGRTGRFECKYCGGSCDKGKCPAFGHQCRHCKKWNHYEAVCRSKQSYKSAARSVNNVRTTDKKVTEEDGWSA